jgi:hypothetical protein
VPLALTILLAVHIVTGYLNLKADHAPASRFKVKNAWSFFFFFFF